MVEEARRVAVSPDTSGGRLVRSFGYRLVCACAFVAFFCASTGYTAGPARKPALSWSELTPAQQDVLRPLAKDWDSLDMADALHPQTLLAYAMNNRPLAPSHGAPLRVRVTRQLGYKSVKYLSRITVTD